jgi:hypothetical protein
MPLFAPPVWLLAELVLVVRCFAACLRVATGEGALFFPLPPEKKISVSADWPAGPKKN